MRMNKKGFRYFCSCGLEYYSKAWKSKHINDNKLHIMTKTRKINALDFLEAIK